MEKSYRNIVTLFIVLTAILLTPQILDCAWLLRETTSLPQALLTISIRIIYILACTSALSFIACGIYKLLDCLHKNVAQGYAAVVLSLSFILSYGDVVMMRVFNRRLSAGEIELIKLTTPKETGSFIKTYYADPRIYIILIVITIIVILGFSISHIINKYDKKLVSVKSFLIFVFSSAILLYANELVSDNVHYRRRFPGFLDSYSNLIHEYGVYKSLESEVDECGLAQLNAIIDKCEYKSENIVIIIGESFNRHHSSLYGYEMKTNPKLEKQDNLYLFDQVIAAENVTMQEFHHFLSMASADDSCGWKDVPLMTTLIKKAGYNVWFYSNQYPKEEYTTSRFGGQFLNNNLVDSLGFTYRNTELFRYDEEMVNQFTKTYNRNNNQRNIIILHLMGQHFAPQDQYPEEFDIFKIENIKKKGLSDRQKQQVAYYDNATLYNDFVVNKIMDYFAEQDALIIYFADHGDEVNDFRAHVGRAFDFENGADVLCNQLDIPFMIKVTDKYKENHPDELMNIERAQHYKFMIDDLPHVILGLCGIECKWYKPEKDLLNKKYNTKRKRLVGGQKYNYDEICK